MQTETQTASHNMSTDTISQGDIDLSSFVDPTKGASDMPTINPNDLNEAFDQQERGTAGTESAPDDKQAAPAKETENKQENKPSAPTLEADKQEKPDPTKPRSRAEERLKEVLPQLKTFKQEIADLKAQLAKNKPAGEKTRLPKPQNPSTYTREQLDQLEAHYEANGDPNGLRAVRNEIRKLDKYENDLRFWTLENGQAEKEYQAHKQHYDNLANTKFQGYQDPESEVGQHYAFVTSKALPQEILKTIQEHPMGEFLLASLADLRVHASKAVALGEQLKKAQEVIAGYEKKAQPLKPSTVQKAGADKSDDDPRKEFVSDLDAAFKARGIV